MADINKYMKQTGIKKDNNWLGINIHDGQTRQCYFALVDNNICMIPVDKIKKINHHYDLKSHIKQNYPSESGNLKKIFKNSIENSKVNNGYDEYPTIYNLDPNDMIPEISENSTEKKDYAPIRFFLARIYGRYIDVEFGVTNNNTNPPSIKNRYKVQLADNYLNVGLDNDLSNKIIEAKGITGLDILFVQNVTVDENDKPISSMKIIVNCINIGEELNGSFNGTSVTFEDSGVAIKNGNSWVCNMIETNYEAKGYYFCLF